MSRRPHANLKQHRANNSLIAKQYADLEKAEKGYRRSAPVKRKPSRNRLPLPSSFPPLPSDPPRHDLEPDISLDLKFSRSLDSFPSPDPSDVQNPFPVEELRLIFSDPPPLAYDQGGSDY